MIVRHDFFAEQRFHNRRAQFFGNLDYFRARAPCSLTHEHHRLFGFVQNLSGLL